MRILIPVALALSLGGCGVVYNGMSVQPGVSAEGKVRVLPITAETVMVANKSAYAPQALPPEFSRTAGTRGSVTARTTAPSPAHDGAVRPGPLPTRLPPPVTTAGYSIGVGDVVLLATRDAGTTVEQLSGILAAQNSRQGYTVQDDGTISIPNVGRVRIAGLTVDAAEAALFQRFIERQVDPTFSLEVAEFRSKKATIGGAVAAPAVVPITLSPLYLDEALAAAGGARVDDMDYASVRIYRDGTMYQIPLADLYRNTGARRIRLAAGDSVFVDTEYELAQASAYFEEQIRLVGYRQAEQQVQLNALNTEIALRRAELQERRSNFAARAEMGEEARDYVYITGEVARQSRYPLPYGRRATLADALYEGAGGIPARTGSPKEIYVLRGSDQPLEYQSVSAWHLDARNAASLMLATRFELRPNDVIFVAAHPVTHWSNVVNAITPTLLATSVNAAAN